MENWISMQRTALGKGRLAQERVARLEKLGMLPYGSGIQPAAHPAAGMPMKSAAGI